MKPRGRQSYLGIDLGASLIKHTLIASHGDPEPVHRIETDASGGRESVLSQICEIISEVRLSPEGADLSAVGLGTPGLINNRGEVIGEAINIPGWHDFPLQETVRAFADLPVFAANDVSLTAFGEFLHGAGRTGTSRNLVCLSVGTGIGGGLVFDGELYLGSCGLAAEIGHLIVEPGGVPCECGQRGCLEQYASAKGIIRSCLEMSRAYDSPLAELSAGTPRGITAETVFRFLREGDPLAGAVAAQASRMLARGIGHAINLLSPDLIVLCGGVMRSADLILPKILDHLEECSLPITRKHCTVLPGRLGSDAGVIGAAAYAQHLIRNRPE